MMLEQAMSSKDLDQLRIRINDEDYMFHAIERIAHVLSNELVDFVHGGKKNERRRKTG